ncbi:MAG: hypothetical protein EPN74_15990 [Rhodanobacter sp.]|nr:MAG: hypothetical protein EPN74_15990 [Rhodanobacter sp.]
MSAHAVVPLPGSEATAWMQELEPCKEPLSRTEVRRLACLAATSERASIHPMASTRPSPQSSPRRGEEANARSEEFH